MGQARQNMFKWLKYLFRKKADNTTSIRIVLHRTMEEKDKYTRCQMKIAMWEAIENQVKLKRIVDSEADDLMRLVNRLLTEHYGKD